MHKMFFWNSQHPVRRSFLIFWFFPVFTVCVLLSVWVESLIISWAGLFSGCLRDEAERKHFLAVSWGQSAWKVFEDCEIQDKIDVHLSPCGFLSLPLVPHICPLFTAFLTPPQLRGFNWMWRHIKGGGEGGRDGHIPLEPRGRHARHRLNVKTASAASSAPYEWGRPNPPTPRSIRWKIRSLQRERKKLLNSFTANVAAQRWLKMTFYPVKCVWVMMHFLPFSFPSFAPTWDHHYWDLIWFDTPIYMYCFSKGEAI